MEILQDHLDEIPTIKAGDQIRVIDNFIPAASNIPLTLTTSIDSSNTLRSRNLT